MVGEGPVAFRDLIGHSGVSHENEQWAAVSACTAGVQWLFKMAHRPERKMHAKLLILCSGPQQ